ncbi:putative multidrug resistance ABC transporter [Echria macrotheca]|uniref:Multidrug resistance ABC transporter n=1 Tax=Echria macrotheca TaxID=438768 RepID=A0AAJ0B6I7_9PEZI|nr:putative multidrug resistance ABC transporter [Echria macrotheca]
MPLQRARERVNQPPEHLGIISVCCSGPHSVEIPPQRTKRRVESAMLSDISLHGPRTVALRLQHGEEYEFLALVVVLEEGDGEACERGEVSCVLWRENGAGLGVDCVEGAEDGVVGRNPALDPLNESFNIKAWLSSLTSFLSRNGNPNFVGNRFGISFHDLSVSGRSRQTDYQKTVSNVLLEPATLLIRRLFGGGGNDRKSRQVVPILQGIDGLVLPGEMLLVLGRPGSGCSTFLKTISGDTHGLHLGDDDSSLRYRGIPARRMHRDFGGELLYMAERDVHFPQLSVEQTLAFAAAARTPSVLVEGVSADVVASRLKDVALAAFGLRAVAGTNVGGELVKGISGGERKRVSIAEAMLGGSAVQCWDNSTRGLDSANAVEFCGVLKGVGTTAGTTMMVALYQAPQAAYDMFDRVTILHQGRQIYFGPCQDAATYFEGLGFERAPRQTTPDFLTSVTSSERRIRSGMECLIPRTPEEFVQRWRDSAQYKVLLDDILAFNTKFPLDSSGSGSESSYVLPFAKQVRLCVTRGFQRLQKDASITITGVVVNSILALVVSSAFYDLDETTNSFYSRSVLIFLSLLLNAFASAMEILLLYAQRPIIEKQVRYAFYRLSAEALAGLVTDLPYKIGNAIFFNLVLYFMTNLRRTPSAFFTFLLFSFCTTLAMSHMYRTFGALSRTLAEALVPVALIILALIASTGFAVPPGAMVPWLGWVRWVNPIAYAFESLMVNEFWDREFVCASFVPDGPGYSGLEDERSQVCAAVGAAAGERVVLGAEYLRLTYGYEREHLWRNFGILLAFVVFYLGAYIVASELVSSKKTKGEVLMFPRGQRPMIASADVEQPQVHSSPIQASSTSDSGDAKRPPPKRKPSVLHWRDVCFDISIGKESRRILDHVDGWIKPGSITALLGPSGAGKTTLLDVLATRNTTGTVTGQICVAGHPRDTSFQRKTGYAQQFDLHLPTDTVREALQFSALMRQPSSTVPNPQKLDHVEHVIRLLEMDSYASAVVSSLNIEQRKKLTIAVELAARLDVLLFLDEPTSGLDSQTAWAVLDLLSTLRKEGQAVLCTVHQPSGPLLERFDRLLFLCPDGRPAYFGPLGQGCAEVIAYFERNGADRCAPGRNPAEWIMEVVGCAPGTRSEVDWPAVWRASPEYKAVRAELERMEVMAGKEVVVSGESVEYGEFAVPYHTQFSICVKRALRQSWRSPTYIYSKLALTTVNSLFLGLVFYHAENTIQGLRDQSFSIFLVLTIFPNYVPQILPNLVAQRDLYEARERPSRVYAWPVFFLSSMAVEILWSTLAAAPMFVAWYFPIGFYRNIDSSTANERGAAVFLLLWAFLLFATTFAYLAQAAIETAEGAGNAANGLFTFWLVFCGVLVSPTALPGFWTFMYRLSPFTYLIGAVLSNGLAHTKVQCSPIEMLSLIPPTTQTCETFMAGYIQSHGGYVVQQSEGGCQYCPVGQTDAFLEVVGIRYEDRWRDFGILWAYILFNALAAVFVYWLARVPKRTKMVERSERSAAVVTMP